MKTIHFLIFLVVPFSIMSGCKHESTVPLANLTSDSTRYKGVVCNKDTVYFFNTIGPLIITSCASMNGCHSGNGSEAGSLTNYSNIMKYISRGNPSSSRLYTVLNAGGEEIMPRLPYAPFTATQKAMVSKWIQQGAKNNGCIDTSCDTTIVTYSGSIAPIFATNCIVCHSSSSSSSTKLDSYTGVKTVVTAGRILGATQHLTGYLAMPPGSSLSLCNITKIKAWIQKGSLNN